MKACVIFCLTVVASVTMSVHCTPVDAAFAYLTGAQLYAAGSNGGISSTANNYRYSTNKSDNRDGLYVWSSSMARGDALLEAITFEVMTGVPNTFFFESETNFSPGDTVGLNLFFTDTDGESPVNSYNPSSGNIAGELAIFTKLGTTSFDYVAKDAPVQDYVFADSPISQKPIYDGAKFFVVGLGQISVTAFQAVQGPSSIKGSFTLSVTATPEPATLGLGALAACGLAGFARKRWNNRKCSKCAS